MKQTNGRTKQNAGSSGENPRVFRAFLIILLIFIFEFFFRTWCGVQCIRTGYEITAAEERQEELLEMQKSLKIERARLTAPQALARVAEERLDLKTPEPEQQVVLP